MLVQADRPLNLKSPHLPLLTYRGCWDGTSFFKICYMNIIFKQQNLYHYLYFLELLFWLLMHYIIILYTFKKSKLGKEIF